MSKDYNQFELPDFIHNKSFLAYAIGNNPKDRQRWKLWLKSSPSNKHIAEKAYQVLNLMNKQGSPQVTFSKDDEFEKLMHRIDNQRLSKNEFSERSLRKWLKVAAMIIVLVSFGITCLVVGMAYRQNSTITYNKITVPKGSKTKVELEDGTIVWLNAESTLQYPSKFSKSERKVKLVGEAYFVVNKSVNRPFVVLTSDIRINVLGTSFNVKNYPQDDIIETTLESGVVNIEKLNTKGKAGEKIILKPNQKLVLFKSSLDDEIKQVDEKSGSLRKSDLITRQKINGEKKSSIYNDVDTETYTSWKDGKLVFKNEPLNVLAGRLEKWYDINIQITDESLRIKTYTGIFEKETVEQALKAICLTSNINFKIDKNNVTIYK